MRITNEKLTKISAFVFTFCFSICVLVIFNLLTGTFTLQDHSALKTDIDSVCDYKDIGEVFSARNYFSSNEVNKLLGKRVRNLKCGKIKCQISLNNCSAVQINELGKIKSLIPRQRDDGYIIVVEWDKPDLEGNFTYLEKGADKYVSYIGKDNSYEVLDLKDAAK